MPILPLPSDPSNPNPNPVLSPDQAILVPSSPQLHLRPSSTFSSHPSAPMESVVFPLDSIHRISPPPTPPDPRSSRYAPIEAPSWDDFEEDEKRQVLPTVKGTSLGAISLRSVCAKPGAAYWRHLCNAGDMNRRVPALMSRSMSMRIMLHSAAAAPLASPMRSNATSGDDHNLWPLCSPAPSYLLGIQDSRGYYLGVDAAYVGAVHQRHVQGQAQSAANGSDATLAMHDDRGGESMDLDYEAAAPAYKVPRAP